jgi:hypothetical protein
VASIEEFVLRSLYILHRPISMALQMDIHWKCTLQRVRKYSSLCTPKYSNYITELTNHMGHSSHGQTVRCLVTVQNELRRFPYIQVKGKVNVKLSLCLTKHHAMKTYWGVEV